jgi:hypothetical protein
MFRRVLSAAAVLLAAVLAQPAGAADRHGDVHDDPIRIWKPYVIEKNCAHGFDYCTVRMDYAPHQRAMVARPGSYWYQKPFQVYSYGDFRHRRHHHLAGGHWSRHVAWCSERYRTYDPHSDTFVGKGYRHYRCDSPYDGR